MSGKHPIHQTAPENFTRLPLTPPPTIEKTAAAVSLVAQEIKNRRDGQGPSSPAPWTAYTLSTEEYADLLEHLRRDTHLWEYTRNKLRYDYFLHTSQFVLRMPLTVHESLISSVAKEVDRQIASIARGQTSSALFAQEIDNVGSATLEFLDADFGKHDPDLQFRHTDAKYSGIVIEVSNSQKKKALPDLADDYILGSDADVRVVIGLDLDYRGGKKATLSVWRPEIVEERLVVQQTVVDQVFRDEEGNPNNSPEAGIYLQLHDFASEELSHPYGTLDDPITISGGILCAFLDRAEKKAAGVFVRSEKPWKGKRRRDQTPPEELSDGREKRFRLDEERVAQQADKADSSFEASLGSESN